VLLACTPANKKNVCVPLASLRRLVSWGATSLSAFASPFFRAAQQLTERLVEAKRSFCAFFFSGFINLALVIEK